jgi:hypothetical protein
MPPGMSTLLASIKSTPAATPGVRRHSTRPATALSQPPVTFTWKPSRSVNGQFACSLPSSRVLQNGRKPSGHIHSSDWWHSRIGNASPATHTPSSRSSPRRAAANDHVGTTSPGRDHGPPPVRLQSHPSEAIPSRDKRQHGRRVAEQGPLAPAPRACIRIGTAGGGGIGFRGHHAYFRPACPSSNHGVRPGDSGLSDALPIRHRAEADADADLKPVVGHPRRPARSPRSRA